MIFREARREDVPAIVALLAADSLGAGREVAAGDTAYDRAFDEIAADPRNLLIVADDDGAVVGCVQVTYIPGLSRRGAERALLEGVRVRADRRGRGLGRELIAWCVDAARERGCALVQLTTDKRRADAHRFYERLGFVASHEGMKLSLR